MVEILRTPDSYGIELLAHQKKCQSFFGDIMKGKPLYLSIDRTESENGLEEIVLENVQYVRVSILTERLIEYDIEMINTEPGTNFINNYRPYFISFIVPLEEGIIQAIETLGSDWYNGQFIWSKETFEDADIVLNGILETSASPVNCLDGKLLVFKNKAIDKSILDKINDTYDPHKFVYTHRLDIEKVLNDAWAGDFPKTIDIYNVGHGNADYIRGFNHRILYDIGYNYRSFPKYSNAKYLRAVNAIRHMKPDCVILSHWDMDHIIGCAYAEQSIFSQKWIAPYLVSGSDKSAKPNAIRLAHYLKVLGNLYLVDREQQNKLIATISCADDVEMKLWLGTGTSILTSKNREGLMIEISDKRRFYSHILLAGDVPYKCMPNILTEPIDFMHVPHHCSKLELGRLKNIPWKGSCAIISTNRKKNKELNYDSEHHKKLEDIFDNVVNTIDSTSGNDEANLSVRINYRNKSFCFR